RRLVLRTLPRREQIREGDGGQDADDGEDHEPAHHHGDDDHHGVRSAARRSRLRRSAVRIPTAGADEVRGIAHIAPAVGAVRHENPPVSDGEIVARQLPKSAALPLPYMLRREMRMSEQANVSKLQEMYA